MNIEIANRLVELRKKSGLSQEELAAKLGLSRQAVSKWERAEASPDTDNLICLAKLYGVSLDDLLDTDQSVDDIARNAKEQSKAEEKAAPKDEAKPNEGGAAASSSNHGKIHLEDGDDKIDIDLSGINVNVNSTKVGGEKASSSTTVDNKGIHTVDKDGNTVDIDDKGIHITRDGKTTVVNGDSGYHHHDKKSAFSIVSDVATATISLLCVAAYLLMGFLLTDKNVGWQVGWPVFFLIPIVPTLFEAIKTKRFCTFCFPCLVAGVYLFLGMYGNYIGVNFWHPWWLLFISIPVYYCIFSPIDSLIHRNEEKKCVYTFHNGDHDEFSEEEEEDLKEEVDDAKSDLDEAKQELNADLEELKACEQALDAAKANSSGSRDDYNERVASAKDDHDDAADEVRSDTAEVQEATRAYRKAWAAYCDYLRRHGKEAPSEDDAPSVDPTQNSSANSTAGAVDAEVSDKPKAK
jgi:transcriptional regulator with XRE-family HTH domain